ncbi:hypothetical protein BST97_03405 [Nonlabens spongiae]|uniref:GIY-YIG domain-containing protein n=1 Tax=Nonlabens spongiae TaxID=331648 RepID=A0A1W6MHP6_9FLAO|nr:GIY-YIG nuclease family protein [Nonlabens spongiae]ARN77115.1 hypothetical protein BST97_03405 [Nonlabens spongiae]
MQFHTVYILKCNDGKFYTGCSSNFEQRLEAHQNGEVSFTKTRLPVTVVQLSQFIDKKKAYDFERYLKSGSGIAFRNKRLV